MQQEKKETENSNDNDVMRKDYTNLQLVYGAKLCIFTIVSIATILQTLNNFQALIAGGFTYCVGILFDFVVIIFTIGYIVIMELEHEKQKRNPIPKKDNSDKRFCKVNNIYSHKIFEVKRGN